MLPIEVMGPDAAHALEMWLEKQGHPCIVVEPIGERAGSELVSALFDAVPPQGGVVMFIIADSDHENVAFGLHLLNQRRDSLAQALGSPLLWCGSRDFFNLTWKLAPDFWSVADVPRTIGRPAWIPERIGSLIAGATQATELERHRELYQEALAQGNRRITFQFGLRVAEEYATTNSFAAAKQTLEKLSAMVVESDDLQWAPRITLLKAKLALATGAIKEAHKQLTALLRSPGIHSDDVGAEIQLCLGHVYAHLNQFEAARNAYDEAHRFYANAPGYSRKRGEVLVAMGDYEAKFGRFKSAETYYEAARNAYEQSADLLGDVGRANVELALGDLYLATSRSREAEAKLLEAFQIYHVKDVVLGKANCLRSLAKLYSNLNRWDEAREAYQNALKIVEHIAFQPWIDTLRAELDALPSA